MIGGPAGGSARPALGSARPAGGPGRRADGRAALLGTLAIAFALAGCPPGGDDDSSDVQEGACDEGDATCVDESTLQLCEAGIWGEPRACEPVGEGIAVRPTWCQEKGFCLP